jgi:hypothetical protein
MIYFVRIYGATIFWKRYSGREFRKRGNLECEVRRVKRNIFIIRKLIIFLVWRKD